MCFELAESFLVEDNKMLPIEAEFKIAEISRAISHALGISLG
jgi:hypothetical protein